MNLKTHVCIKRIMGWNGFVSLCTYHNETVVEQNMAQLSYPSHSQVYYINYVVRKTLEMHFPESENVWLKFVLKYPRGLQCRAVHVAGFLCGTIDQRSSCG